MPSNGYGYGDDARDKLGELFATIFRTESALVSPHFASGTHTLACALFGVLRPGNIVLVLTGRPYDTLQSVIESVGTGSLADFGISFEYVPLVDGRPNKEEIAERLSANKYAALYIQRSPGYERRKAFSVSEIAEMIDLVKKYTDAPVIVDNCYGEFVETTEPSEVGADLIVGSLIKNPGGAMAPTGGYIAGKKALVDLAAMRLTAPGIGAEVGSYEHTYRNFYQGLFMAPHIVARAYKKGIPRP